MIAELIEKLLSAEELEAEHVAQALDLALRGELSDARLAGLLVALRTRPLDGPLLAAAARAVRAHQESVPLAPSLADAPLVDTCGTGGDGARTFNVSTAAALTVAACGARVAKHGNRGVSSKSGSADVLEALGLPLGLAPEASAKLLQRCGFAFLFAPRHHPALARVAPVRRELGVRTIFNLLGPLLNPAGARRQLLGVYAPELTAVVAEACRELGSERVLVVHCAGLDELGLHAETRGHLLERERIEPFVLDPRELGLPPADPGVFAVADVDAAAQALLDVISGEDGPRADLVALNAGAALFAAGLAGSVPDGFGAAREALFAGRVAEGFVRIRAEARKLAAEEAA